MLEVFNYRFSHAVYFQPVSQLIQPHCVLSVYKLFKKLHEPMDHVSGLVVKSCPVCAYSPKYRFLRILTWELVDNEYCSVPTEFNSSSF